MKKLAKKVKISVNEHGCILINEKFDQWAKILTTLKAYLAEILQKNQIKKPRESALNMILFGRLDGNKIILSIPPEIQKENPQEKEWEITLDIKVINEFFLKRMCPEY